MGRRFMASGLDLSVTGTGDFLQLRNGSDLEITILELHIFQDADLNFAINRLRIRRGSNGAGGFDHTEWEYDVTGEASGVTVVQLATTPVDTFTWEKDEAWNILQPYTWLPTLPNEETGEPGLQLVLAGGDHLGVSLATADILNMGFFVAYEEIGT